MNAILDPLVWLRVIDPISLPLRLNDTLESLGLRLPKSIVESLFWFRVKLPISDPLALIVTVLSLGLVIKLLIPLISIVESLDWSVVKDPRLVSS